MSMVSQGLSACNFRSPRYSHIEAASGCAKEKGFGGVHSTKFCVILGVKIGYKFSFI